MRVRSLRADDLAELVALAPASHAPLVAAAVARALAGENQILVAELDGQVVGQVWLDVARRRAQGVAVVQALRVAPAQQSRGIGRALLAAAERLAARLGFGRVEVGIADDDPWLCAMYARRGYRPAGSRVDVESWCLPSGESQSARFDQAIFEKDLTTVM